MDKYKYKYKYSHAPMNPAWMDVMTRSYWWKMGLSWLMRLADVFVFLARIN